MNFHRAAIDGLMPGEPDRICDIWTEINRNLEAEFQESEYPKTVDDFLSRREMMDFRVMERLRARVDAVVKDKETAAILKPWYRHMCKRPASSDEFYPAFNRSNVRLLDVSRTQGVELLTRRGFMHESTEYDIDCLIFASGFEVTSDLRRRWGIDEISGRGGQSLYDRWAHEFRTLHGVMTHGFPNQFYRRLLPGRVQCLDDRDVQQPVLPHRLDHRPNTGPRSADRRAQSGIARCVRRPRPRSCR